MTANYAAKVALPEAAKASQEVLPRKDQCRRCGTAGLADREGAWCPAHGEIGAPVAHVGPPVLQKWDGEAWDGHREPRAATVGLTERDRRILAGDALAYEYEPLSRPEARIAFFFEGWLEPEYIPRFLSRRRRRLGMRTLREMARDDVALAVKFLMFQRHDALRRKAKDG